MQEQYVCVIGAANIDISGFPKHKLQMGDSTIGRLSLSIGGVGRNIAENLVRLGLSTKLMAPIGDDLYGKKIIENCNEIGIDVSDALFMENTNSSVFLAVMNDKNDLAVAIAAMSICEKLDEAFIDSKRAVIEQASVVVLETNIPSKVLKYIVDTIPNQKYMLDTVAGDKAAGCLDVLHNLHTLKTNEFEAETLSKQTINKEEDLPKVAEFFHDRGVTNVFITMGKKGSFYSNRKEQGIVLPKPIEVVSTIGAGDSFISGLVFSELQDYDLNKSVRFASACANMTVSTEATVNPQMTSEAVLESL